MNLKPILVVEDDPAVRSLLQVILRRQGHQVDGAADGLDALECIERQEYALILLDLMMPRMDGLTFLRHARERGCTTPVIVLTAAKEQFIGQLEGASVAGLFRKPFDIAEIPSVVNELIHAVGETDRTSSHV